jgi:hypothetical protein
MSAIQQKKRLDAEAQITQRNAEQNPDSMLANKWMYNGCSAINAGGATDREPL